MNAGEESPGQLVVAGGDAAKVLEFVEKPLDAIALPVEFFVVAQVHLATGARGDDHATVVPADLLTNGIAVKTLVGDHGLRINLLAGLLIDGREVLEVAFRTRTEQRSRGHVLAQGGQVDFGSQPAARASQSLCRAVFFGAPAAC
jgi:hypothetical protein